MSRLYHLRSELEFSTQTRQGKSYLVVKDPVTNRYFNFKEMQASIVELVREPIDIDSLGAAAAARLGATVKEASLEGFLNSLEEKHLLDTPTVAENSPPTKSANHGEKASSTCSSCRSIPRGS